MDRLRARLAGQGRELALGRAAAHDQVAPPLAQRLPQLAQRLEQEPRPGVGREAPAEQPIVEHEGRDHPLGAAGRGRQGGVVVHAQVAAEPDDRGARHHPRIRRRDARRSHVDLVRCRSSGTSHCSRWASWPSRRSSIPLHIFEDRYKTMIGRCLDEESEFGIVWMADDGLRPVGCACEIARGRRAARGRPHQPHRPRHAPVPDRGAPGGAALSRGHRRVPRRQDRGRGRRGRRGGPRRLREPRQRGHRPHPGPRGDRRDERLRDGGHGRVRARRQAGPARPPLEAARLRLVTRLFRAAVKRLDFVNRAQARARSNGKVHFGT